MATFILEITTCPDCPYSEPDTNFLLKCRWDGDTSDAYKTCDYEIPRDCPALIDLPRTDIRGLVRPEKEEVKYSKITW